jgi:hypothetical protein
MKDAAEKGVRIQESKSEFFSDFGILDADSYILTAVFCFWILFPELLFS